jgi:phage baseplate assembly protein V
MREGGDDPDMGELIRFGTVAEVDHAARRCVVSTGDLQTGPIRWMAGRAGGTKHWSPPTVGEQVMLLCPGGEFTAAVAMLGLSSDANELPGNSTKEVTSYPDGAIVSYDPATHALEAVLPAGGTARIVAPGGITLEGDVLVKGELTVEQDVIGQADVKAGAISLKTHKHGGVTAGGAQTAVPA